MKYEIYQLKHDCKDYRYKVFSPLKWLEHDVEIEDYEKVYEGEVDDCKSVNMTLEKIYMFCQGCSDPNYRGHSLSVSDIVKIDGCNYYCDDYGFKKI